jgi:hypothetical protein
MDLHMFFIPLAERSSLNNHHHPTETILALCENKVYDKFFPLHEKANTLECIVCNKLFFGDFFDETPDFKKLESIYESSWESAIKGKNIALFADEILLRMAEQRFRKSCVPIFRKQFNLAYQIWGGPSLPSKEVNPVRLMISKIDSCPRIEPFFPEYGLPNFNVLQFGKDELHALGDRAMYFRQ